MTSEGDSESIRFMRGMCPQTHAHVKKTAHENCEKPAILKAIMRFATETRLVSERFGRFERGGARGGIDSRQQADHAADGWREQGSERVEHWSPDLIRRDTHHDQYADAGSEQSPHDTHGRTLNEELCRDVAASRANGTAQSNLRRPLHHAHQGDICDPKRADHERQAA